MKKNNSKQWLSSSSVFVFSINEESVFQRNRNSKESQLLEQHGSVWCVTRTRCVLEERTKKKFFSRNKSQFEIIRFTHSGSGKKEKKNNSIFNSVTLFSIYSISICLLFFVRCFFCLFEQQPTILFYPLLGNIEWMNFTWEKQNKTIIIFHY